MAERKPLTLVGNRPGELPAGDNLPYTVLPQAWTHPALGAPIGSMLVYAAIARATDPPDTFAFWATETDNDFTDAIVTITGAGYIGFNLQGTPRARANLGLGALAVMDVPNLISADVPNALSVSPNDGGLVATGGSQPGVTFILDTGADLQNGDSELAEFAPSDKGPWSGWSMQITPAGGTVELDVLVDGVSITTGGSKPAVNSGSTATGDLSGWAGDSVSAGQSMEVSVFAVSGSVERVALYLHP